MGKGSIAETGYAASQVGKDPRYIL